MITNAKTVTVTVTMPTGNKSIQIAVSEEPVELSLAGVTYDGIEWTIASDGWTFTRIAGNSTGIKVKNGGGRFLDNGGLGSQFKKHRWERPNGQQDGGTYQYTISVTNETTGVATPTTLIWDPTIHNN